MPSQIFISLETSAFSGATLLAILMGAHPEITTVGEMRGLIDRANPDTYLCSCGKNIKKCDFWEAVSISMKRKGYKFDVANFDTKYQTNGPRLLFDLRHGSSRNILIDSLRDKIIFSVPGEIKKMKNYSKRSEAFVASVLEISGNNVFVDSSKSKMLLRTLPKYTDLDVRAVHLIRRPEGVVASSIRRDNNSNASIEAKNWVKRHRRIELSMKFLPPAKSMIVRYEDLCEDTETTLKGLYSFCGVGQNYPNYNYDSTRQHVIGNPMRLKPISKIVVDERWKKELDQKQLSIIHDIARELGRHYGYY